MCGIAGIWHLDKTTLETGKLERFTDSMSHRGPDGSGYKIFMENMLGFGHRRLSILDLSESGKQPMEFGQNKLWITFNGEIYNFIELRNELKTHGFNFKSESDTEVVLAAYSYWGKDCFNKFNGMWAIAIYDLAKNSLLLSRDRFGVKPFYYLQTSKLFAFASETIAFKNLDGFNLTPNNEILSQTIDNPVLTEGTGYTIWNNILQLLPGHFMEINLSKPAFEQKRWFQIEQKPLTISYREAKEEFFKLFENAVKLRLRSDVPVATALSGGLDSSSVYSMLYFLKSKNIQVERTDFNRIKGFVATFEGTMQDETEYARSIVEHCEGEAEFLKTDFNNIIQNIESSTKLFNDISATPICVLGDVYRGMRKSNYIVSLDGHGVDEMLYGYRSLAGMAITQSVMSLDSTNEEDLTQTYLSMFHDDVREQEKEKLYKRVQSLKQILGINTAGGKLKHKLKQNIKKIKGNSAEFFSTPTTINSNFLSTRNLNPLKNLSDKPVSLSNYSIAEKELAIDFYYRNIPYNMRDFDKAAMQHGIEIRMPFMDYNLVNFVFNLPTEFKIGGGYTKRIMRDSFSSILPEKVRTRKLKIGMGAPINDWFNNQLSSYISDTVSSSNFLQNELWRGTELQKMVHEKCKNKNWTLAEAQQFWNILNAHLILQ